MLNFLAVGYFVDDLLLLCLCLLDFEGELLVFLFSIIEFQRLLHDIVLLSELFYLLF